jgi:hypothetical protein
VRCKARWYKLSAATVQRVLGGWVALAQWPLSSSASSEAFKDSSNVRSSLAFHRGGAAPVFLSIAAVLPQFSPNRYNNQDRRQLWRT